jgi:hypothetical protein
MVLLSQDVLRLHARHKNLYLRQHVHLRDISKIFISLQRNIDPLENVEKLSVL